MCYPITTIIYVFPDSHNVILLLSDGGSLDLAPVLEQAALTKQAGIDIVVGAVGDWIDMDEVLTIFILGMKQKSVKNIKVTTGITGLLQPSVHSVHCFLILRCQLFLSL